MVTKGLRTASAAAATGCPVGSSGVVLLRDVITGRTSSTPREQTAADIAGRTRCGMRSVVWVDSSLTPTIADIWGTG